jgi:hypothetical protein
MTFGPRYMATTLCGLPCDGESVPLTPPQDDSQRRTYKLRSVHVTDSQRVMLVWCLEPATHPGQQCNCGELLGPPFAEGMRLTCRCGQRYFSKTDRRVRMLRWYEDGEVVAVRNRSRDTKSGDG